jgi:UDP-N-acetylmuramoylalanine--D-glutamate ligase
MTLEERIRDRKIGVLGMARSGMAAARLAMGMGGKPFVSDSGTEEKLQAQCDELKSQGIPYETGGHTDRLLGSDYLIISPGIPLKVEIVRRAQEKGIPIFSELEIASWVCPGRIAAITGANGKTTTTTLTGEILAAAGFDTHVCGNIGRPFAGIVSLMRPESVAVVEVSSFQLETVVEFAPYVAAILNLTPDHIDRHGSFEAYRKIKYRITENQTVADVFITNRDDAETVADNPASNARRLWFTAETRTDCDVYVRSERLCVRRNGAEVAIIPVDEIGIKGPHNLQNAAAATAIALQFDVDPETIARVLRTFAGVEHRLEPAGTVAGVAFVNDSKATNVDSVAWALRSFRTPIHLIAGGRDKAGVFEPLIEIGRGKIKSIVVIGEAAEKIFNVMGKSFPTQFAGTLEEAVEKCFEAAVPGETVLLSPGCASFDMFDTIEHRGRAFKKAVAELRHGKNGNTKTNG